MSPKFKKIIRVAIVTATIATVTAYLLACLVPFLDASKHSYIALLGIAFPLLFFVLLALLIYWCIRKSRWAWVCTVSLLLSWQMISVVFGFHINQTFRVQKQPENLRIFSWNVSSWGESNRADAKNNMAEMVALMKSSNADVLCLQEFLYYKTPGYRDSIIPGLIEAGYKYVYYARPDYSKGRFYTTSVLTAIEILSKHPILETGKFIYSEDDFNEPLISADILFNNQRVRIFTTHLQSVRFGNHDLATLYTLKEPAKASVQETRAVIGKIKLAYAKRVAQAEFLDAKIKASPYPVVVCGDFNDPPSSYTYFTVKGNLQDAFLKKGGGMGRTFRFLSPTLRIDYVLADKKFSVEQYTNFKVTHSDHYPVVVDLKWK